MIHNGIEYGMMQAYGEGFEILEPAPPSPSTSHKVAHLWNQGSVVRSWLLELAERAFQKDAAPGRRPRLRRGLRRRALDGAGGDRPQRARRRCSRSRCRPASARARTSPSRAKVIAAAARRVRRPRREEGGVSAVPRLEDSPNPLRVGLRRERVADPCAVVIFGAAGDLTSRKLVPALYNLHARPPASRATSPLVGCGPPAMSDEEFATAMRHAVEEHSRRPLDPELWDELAPRISLRAGRLRRRRGLRAGWRGHLHEVDASAQTRRQPALLPGDPALGLPEIVAAASPRRGSTSPDEGGTWARVVVEKPFGHDLASARELNRDRASRLRRAQSLPHRSLPRQGDGAEPAGLPLRQRDLRAALEPEVRRPRADHGGRGDRGRGARRLLRGGRRRRATCCRTTCSSCCAWSAMEPPVSLDADADPRREGQGAARRCGRSRPEQVAGLDGARAVRRPASPAGKPVPGLPRGEGRGAATRGPRPTWRSGCTSTTGAGRACRSTCAPASGCPSG